MLSIFLKGYTEYTMGPGMKQHLKFNNQVAKELTRKQARKDLLDEQEQQKKEAEAAKRTMGIMGAIFG